MIAWNIEINGAVISLLAIISLILYFVTEGYILSVLKETINLGDEIPALNILENFIDGLKLLVVQIVYYIIPTIIILLVGWISGTYSAMAEVLAFIGNTISDTVDPSMAISAVPQDLWAPLFTGLAITGIVAIILYLIFGLLLEIAMCRLAKYGDIGEAINFKEVIADIQAVSEDSLHGSLFYLFVLSF